MREVRTFKRFFTVLELVVAMAVFSVITLALLQTFSSLQNLWNRTTTRSESYETGRMIMDFISNDLQGSWYSPDNSSAWKFKCSAADWAAGSVMWMITSRSGTYYGGSKRQPSLVVAGYQLSAATGGLFALKRIVIDKWDSSGNLNTDYFEASDGSLKTSPPSSFTNAALLSDRIVSMKVQIFTLNDESKALSATNALVYDNGTAETRKYPLLALITVTIADDGEAWGRASASDRALYQRTFSRTVMTGKAFQY